MYFIKWRRRVGRLSNNELQKRTIIQSYYFYEHVFKATNVGAGVCETLVLSCPLETFLSSNIERDVFRHMSDWFQVTRALVRLLVCSSHWKLRPLVEFTAGYETQNKCIRCTKTSLEIVMQWSQRIYGWINLTGQGWKMWTYKIKLLQRPCRNTRIHLANGCTPDGRWREG